MDLAGGDRYPFALAGAHNQAAGLINGVERTLEGGASGLDRDPLAEPGRTLEPLGADLGKAAAMVPDAPEFDPGIRQRLEELLGADLDAERVQRCRGRRRSLGRGDNIGADADHDG